MRYFLLLAIVLCAVGAQAQYNESVAAISYNPSRLGAYSHLKIAKEAVLQGGIDACKADTSGKCAIHPEVNIMTKGVVNVSGGVDCTGPTPVCHQITNISSMAGEDCSNSDYCGANSNDFTATLQTDNGTLVHGGETAYNGTLDNIGDSSRYNVDFPSAEGTNLEIGGTLTANGNSKVFVKTLDNTLKTALQQGDAKFAATTLIMNGDAQFKVSGDNNTTFKIGKTTIKVNNAKSGTFGWKTRIDKDGNKAKILAMQ